VKTFTKSQAEFGFLENQCRAKTAIGNTSLPEDFYPAPSFKLPQSVKHRVNAMCEKVVKMDFSRKWIIAQLCGALYEWAFIPAIRQSK